MASDVKADGSNIRQQSMTTGAFLRPSSVAFNSRNAASERPQLAIF